MIRWRGDAWARCNGNENNNNDNIVHANLVLLRAIADYAAYGEAL